MFSFIITLILIRPSLEIPSVFCVLWFASDTADSHGSQTVSRLFPDTMAAFQTALSCVNKPYKRRRSKQLLRPSSLFCFLNVSLKHIFFKKSLLLFFLFFSLLPSGCELWVTLACDYGAYSLGSKDEWFHYSRKKKRAGPISGN